MNAMDESQHVVNSLYMYVLDCGIASIPLCLYTPLGDHGVGAIFVW